MFEGIKSRYNQLSESQQFYAAFAGSILGAGLYAGSFVLYAETFTRHPYPTAAATLGVAAVTAAFIFRNEDTMYTPEASTYLAIKKLDGSHDDIPPGHIDSFPHQAFLDATATVAWNGEKLVDVKL